MNRRSVVRLVAVLCALVLGIAAGVPVQASTTVEINHGLRQSVSALGLDFCLEQSLGGPVAHPDDRSGDGLADTCSVRISRRAAVAHQKALETLAEQHRDAYTELVARHCRSDDGCDITPPPPPPPADHPTYWSGSVAAPDFCSDLSSGGPLTHPYDSNGDGVADTCSLPTTRPVAVAHQKALEALADRHRDAYMELVTHNCEQSRSADEDEECAPWLGTVTVQLGESIQIRALTFLSEERHLTNVKAARFAIEDYGPIHGEFTVELGDPVHDPCDIESGELEGKMIAADNQVVGVIGPSCSGTATKASPLLSAEGMVLISFSNTSPYLTSDLFGNPGEYYYPGYYRTAHNDIYQGQAVAGFLLDHLNINRVAVIHTGEAYTQGLAESFRKSFEQRAGTITDFVELAPDETQLSGTLAGIASKKPEVLFMPVYGDLGDNLVIQARQVPEFDDIELVVGDALFDVEFLNQDFTLGVYAVGPDLHFTSDENQATGVSGDQLRERYFKEYDQGPRAGFWPHTYDATTLLLEAIKNSSYIDDSNLIIDRAAVRSYLTKVRNFQGIIGSISCDDFGDCGVPRIDVIENIDPTDVEKSLDNVVYTFSAVPSDEGGSDPHGH